MKDEPLTYYVWRSDTRAVETASGRTTAAAAHQYALRNAIPYNIALRVVPVDLVESFGIVVRGAYE